MIDPPVIQPKETKQRILFVWAVSATLVAFVSTGLAVFFFLQARAPLVFQRSSVSPSPSPFLHLPESAILGSYKWTSQGKDGLITLSADHTFIKDGKPNPGHRWEITRDALVLYWLRSQTRLNRIERPGVYVEIMDGAETARIEKQE